MNRWVNGIFACAAVLAYLLVSALVDAPGPNSKENFVFHPWHLWIAVGTAAAAGIAYCAVRCALEGCTSCKALRAERDKLAETVKNLHV